MIKRILKSGIASLGTISVLAFAPVLLLGTPARAQVVDGRLDEYQVATAPTLTYGEVGPVVEDVQIMLDELGYYDSSEGITGTYDQATQQAVEEFQEDYNLISDGIVGDNTWDTFLSLNEEGIFESDDSFDEDRGFYSDYEDESLDYGNDYIEEDSYGY
ncbi:peptidoglycan-binding domain-containing protein [Capilliphycus salinus ALCB114379]|uniref:peptidoglycan-binding domain-containing protein n=1 Tax=Capilliphycus salinus TaxID=2768948 RepID=UPI0039A4DCFE